MNNHYETALVGGVAGATAMMLASKALRSPVMPTLTQLLGSLVATPRSQESQSAGTVGQLANGALLAQAYRVIFRSMGIRRKWTSGVVLGLVHGALAGIALTAVPAVHPRVPEGMPSPGPFMLNGGVGDAVVLIVLHGLFGAVVGAVIEQRERMT